MKKTAKTTIALGSVLLLFAALAYWYFLSGYFHKPLFCNTYGAEIAGPWHWYQHPRPLASDDGTLVFVDFSKNELCVVSNPAGGSSWILGPSKPSGRDIFIEGRGIEIPACPNSCLYVDKSGVQIIQPLKPNEAKALFEKLRPFELTPNLRAALLSLVPNFPTPTPATAPQNPL